MVRTRVGYAGGLKENPSYYGLGDHSETIQIDYDPTRISYQELLDVFWSSHNPQQRPWSTQYKSMILYHTDEQKRLAMESKGRDETRLESKVFTEIVPFSMFYLAEAYHQKYWLRQVPELLEEFTAIYPTTDDFVASTAVARVNGYVGGQGTCAALQEQLSSLGLSTAANGKLLDLVCPPRLSNTPR